MLDAAGRVTAVVHRAEDVTSVVRAGGVAIPGVGRTTGPADATALSVVDQALLLGSSVDRYADVITRERRASLALQDSVLTPPRASPA